MIYLIPEKNDLNIFGQSLEIPTIVPERFEAAQTEDASQRPAKEVPRYYLGRVGKQFEMISLSKDLPR